MAISATSVSCDEILIQAPAQFVWDILMDFDNYHLWNKFCPEIKGVPEVGSPVAMQVDMGNGPQPQTEYITRLEAPFEVVWSMENKPGDPIHADRMQRVTPVDDSSCRYWTVDDFSGEAVAPMMEAFGEIMERGFTLCAEGLKEYAEALHKERQG